MSDYEKLKALCDEADSLIEQRVTSDDSKFVSWHTKAERFLKGKYGKESDELKKFSMTFFTPLGRAPGVTPDYIGVCKEGLEKTKAIFEVYLQEMEEETSMGSLDNIVSPDDFTKVFIVHGHDKGLKESVARLLEKQSINPIILNEQVNSGKTLIEKFEANSNVGAAICLFTSDDLGQEKSDSDKKPRARQNVVFEAGYFMGKLGREKVIIVSEQGVELPSDMQGVVYTDKNSWKLEVLKELKSIGYPIDFNKMV